jgi:hypothetical protein
LKGGSPSHYYRHLLLHISVIYEGFELPRRKSGEDAEKKWRRNGEKAKKKSDLENLVIRGTGIVAEEKKSILNRTSAGIHC